MTAAARRAVLRSRLGQARAASYNAAGEFKRLCEIHPTRVKPHDLDAAAEAVILAAAEVRMAARALMLHRVRVAA